MLLLALLWGGCAGRSYQKPVAALIVFKTPAIRFADQGFVYRSARGVKVQVYASGRAVLQMRVGRRVCIEGKGCLAEEDFYKKFFGVAYPEGTLAAIFSKRPIFGGEGLRKVGEGYEQRIEEPGRFDIIYAFNSRSARFRDRLNHILIKMTEIK